jgi:carboxyl-terminal processing protease
MLGEMNKERLYQAVKLSMCVFVVGLVGCKSEATSTPKNTSGNINTTNAALTWVSGQYAPLTQYQNRCAAPRSGIDPSTGKPFGRIN